MSGKDPKTPVVVLGGGPAGLGAAFKLARRGAFDVTVVERGNHVGGNAGSFEQAGLRVDFGSHRLHPSCAPEILADIRQMLGENLLDRPRHGRICLLGRWVHFPLKPGDLVAHLPPKFAFGVACDAVNFFRRPPAEENFATVLERGLGRTICRDFYFPYARKIWGVPPEELDAEQARRRVSAGSLGKMTRKILNGVAGRKAAGKGRFFYPRQGFGAISEAYACAAARAGATTLLSSTVSGVEVEDGRAAAVLAQNQHGEEERLPARQILSTIPLSVLVRQMRPAAPANVLAAAAALRFRAMILIYLVLETDRFTEYDAHYFPDAGVGITRLSEPKNYGLATLPGRTVLCAELPCAVDDPVWRAPDPELRDLVLRALSAAGIPVTAKVLETASRRLPNAYPIYTHDYQKHFQLIDEYLNGIDGLLTFGRQGLFAHDNTHHALAMSYAMSECLDDSGVLNRKQWQQYRREFLKHVVED